MPTPKNVWEKDCLKYHGRILTGEYSHWCYEWDSLPIDETCHEWPCNCSWASWALKEKEKKVT
jgi:hypothetical protein